jgi:glycerol-3-phosphate acyltransferase PlsY
MDSLTATVLATSAAYLAGSIPFGFLIGKLVAGIDIRTQGSGNIGATNVGRVLGGKWGATALGLDFFKGLLPVWLIPAAFAGSATSPHLPVLCGIATIVGHMFPCWLGFRGGKGVATALGVVAYLLPVSTLAAFGIFVVSFGVWRIVSLSSVLACLGFAVCQMLRAWPEPFAGSQWSLSAFSLVIPALIIFRHRSNIKRLLRGEEERYRLGSGKGAKPPEAAAETAQPLP